MLKVAISKYKVVESSSQSTGDKTSKAKADPASRILGVHLELPQQTSMIPITVGAKPLKSKSLNLGIILNLNIMSFPLLTEFL